MTVRAGWRLNLHADTNSELLGTGMSAARVGIGFFPSVENNLINNAALFA